MDIDINSIEVLFYDANNVPGLERLGKWANAYGKYLIATVKELTNKLLDKENEIASLNEILVLKDEEIKEKDKKIERLKETLEVDTNLLLNYRDEVASFTDEINDRDSQISLLMMELKDCNDDCNDTVRDLSIDINKLESKVDDLTDELSDCNQLLTSKS